MFLLYPLIVVIMAEKDWGIWVWADKIGGNWLSTDVDKGHTLFNAVNWKFVDTPNIFHSYFPPFIFPLVTALLNALILVVFTHLKLIMKCMHWAKQAINQSRCVSRWVPEQVSGAQRPGGSNSTLDLVGKAEPSPLTPWLSLPTYVPACLITIS